MEASCRGKKGSDIFLFTEKERVKKNVGKRRIHLSDSKFVLYLLTIKLVYVLRIMTAVY